MQSSTRLCLLGLLVALLTVCAAFTSVSADGSIQPFVDQSCSRPLANATNISLVSGPDCQHTKDSSGNTVSFIYFCNSTDFQLSFWYNYTFCADVEAATWHVESDSRLSYCPVALYEDADDRLYFYADLECTTDWAEQPAQADTLTLEPFMVVKQRLLEQTRGMIDTLQVGWSKPPLHEQ